MILEDVFLQIKTDFENTITTASFDDRIYQNGNKAKEAYIRSQKLINLIHDFIKNEFVDLGIEPHNIVPPLGYSKPELKLKGFLKEKTQDICIVPSKESNPEEILSVNVRSQLSSMQKNIDTLFERTFAEALNLHLNSPKQVLGEVYLIPVKEYDDKAMLKNQVAFKNLSKIETYIAMFQSINNRVDINVDKHKYERICLMIVDFGLSKPKIYRTTQELIEDNLLPHDTYLNYEELSIKNFAKDLLKIYEERFGIENLKC